jgi:galactokinase
VRLAVSPGRVNLIGEHTDYNDGFVLPMAIDRYVAVAFALNGLGRARIHSLDFDATRELDYGSLSAPGGSEWYDYVAGVFWALGAPRIELPGLDLVLAGNVPIGAGLSSSAAVELATARVAAEVAGVTWNPKEMALLAQKAENEYVGVSCGIMDQLTVAAGQEGAAVLIDCRSLEISEVSVPAEAVVVVLDTATRRSLAAGAYNERRSSCEDAVRVLQESEPSIKALRDADVDDLGSNREYMENVTFHRALHVVDENRRTVETAEALRAGDLDRAGYLMNDSHSSLRELYEVSSRELDIIARLAREHPACWGARMTGAGFGGCAVALVRADAAEQFTAEVEAAYRMETDLPGTLYVCRPVAGARIL